MDYYEARDTTNLDLPEYTVECFNELSDIQKCFYNKTIFLTGASGFIGSLLLENFLRSCPGIKKIYILLREKRGKTVQERLDILFQNEIYEKLLKKNPNKKLLVSVMHGDVGEPMLGLTDENISIIRNEVNFIIHGAACLRMEEPLKTAYYMNVRATIDLLGLAETMKDLKAFVYVSTAYSHAFRPVISEEFYKPGYDENELKFLLENLGEEEIAAFTPKIIGPWLNTYAFTKAISESVMSKYAGKLPVAVVRPSIIIGCEKEPLKGWINNVYGATGVSAAASLGLMRVWYCDANKIADIIPADKVVNAIVASMWHTSIKFKKNETQVVPIYNSVSSPKAPTTWGGYMDLVEKNAMESQMIPSVLIGEYNFRLQHRKWLYFLQMYIMQLIPALIMDLVFTIKGDTAKLIPGYIKIHKFNMRLKFYTEREWIYQQKNMDVMWNEMSEQDKHLFNYDLTNFDWETYHRTTISGIRLYIFKDPMDTLPQARKKYYKIMRVRQAITLIILLYLYYYYIHDYLMLLYGIYYYFLKYIIKRLLFF